MSEIDSKIIEEVKKLMENVPFGNSKFQIENFILDKNSDSRNYRQVLLEIDSKLKSLMSCKFRRKRIEIDIEEIEQKLNYSELNQFERKRLEIDKEEKIYSLEDEIKLINDCGHEISCYLSALKKLPQFTRDEFEANEKDHWIKKLVSDADCQTTGSGSISYDVIQNLRKLGIQVVRNKDNNQLGYVAEKNVSKIIELLK